MKADDHTITAIRFALWMGEQTDDPSAERVAAYLHCSRATAYRWLQRWRIAHGATP